MLKMQKLESLGTSPAGSPHDFNNLLSVILANLQLAEFKLAKGRDTTKGLKTMGKATFKSSQANQTTAGFR